MLGRRASKDQLPPNPQYRHSKRYSAITALQLQNISITYIQGSAGTCVDRSLRKVPIRCALDESIFVIVGGPHPDSMAGTFQPKKDGTNTSES